MEVSTTLEGVKEVVSFMFGLLGDVVTTIASQPLLLLPVGIFIAGAAIGLGKRLIGN